MNNKTVKGYWSNGRFVKPEEILAEEQGPPSKTQLKAEADEKQALGEALLTLRPDLIKRLDLPEKLLDAIKDCKKITNFEGRRRWTPIRYAKPSTNSSTAQPSSRCRCTWPSNGATN